MTEIRRVLGDPSPEVLRRHARRIAERGLRHEARLIEGFIRLLTGDNRHRCDLCGASTEPQRAPQGACEG
jgi:hypothetical protein